MKISSGVFLLFLLRNSLCIPLNQFYPFGTGSTVQKGDNTASPSLSLQQQIQFYDQPYSMLYVSAIHPLCLSHMHLDKHGDCLDE